MANILIQDIHRLIELNHNLPLNPNQVPKVLSRARIRKRGQLLRDFVLSTDMVFDLNENGNVYIIPKGLDSEPIVGTNKRAEEYGGLSVYRGHPDGIDQFRKGKIWRMEDVNMLEELQKDPIYRETRDEEVAGVTYVLECFACYALEVGTDLGNFNVSWDNSDTTPGVRHGVLYPTEPLVIHSRDPVKFKGKLAYYECSLDPIQDLPWRRCENRLILKASAGYPTHYPRPDEVAERVLSSLLEYDQGSNKEPDAETAECYKLADKLITQQLTSEQNMLQNLDEQEKALVATSLARHISTSDLSDTEEHEIQELIDKFRGGPGMPIIYIQ